MTRKALFIFIFLLLTSRVSGGKPLFEANETIDSSQNDGLVSLPIPFNFELNRGSIYQINFTNLQSSKSSVFVTYYETASNLISSNLSPNNESSIDRTYLIKPGSILVLSYEKQDCELDTIIIRGLLVELVNKTSASIDINAEVTKDTGECAGGDGFLSFPFIPMIFTISIITIIVKSNKRKI